MDNFISQFLAITNQVQLITLLALIFAVVASGIIVAVKNRTFRLLQVGEFLGTKILPLVGGYYLVCLVAVALPDWSEIAPAAYAFLVATYVGFLAKNLKELGLPLPDWVGGNKVSVPSNNIGILR